MSNDVLEPVRDPAVTISVAALSACSSASICCTVRLRLGVPFVVIDVPAACVCLGVSLSAAWVFETPACRSLAPYTDGVAVALAVGAYPVG